MAGQRQGSWRMRRRIIIATLIFCALEAGYITIFGTDTRLNETIVNAAYLLAGSVIASYVFGAVWEDTKIPKMGDRNEPLIRKEDI